MIDERLSAEEIRIIEAAAGWFARSNDGPLDPAERVEFEHWLGADPRHLAAYGDMERLWQRAGAVGEIRRHGKSGQASRRQLLMLAGLGLAGGLALAFAGQPRADIETGKGERRNVALSDGSVLELAADTALRLAFDARQRRVELLRGEVFAEVAAGALPFTIAARAVEVTALGTAFGVAHSEGGVRTVVAKHAVRVVAGGQEQRVGEGEALSVDGGTLGQLEPVRAGVDLAWREGRLSFANAPLGEVTATINRWRGNQLVLMPGLGEPAVTLIGDIGDLDAMVETLARAISARLIAIGPWMTLVVPG